LKASKKGSGICSSIPSGSNSEGENERKRRKKLRELESLKPAPAASEEDGGNAA